MSELKMKTIGSLPLIEEPAENATIMGLEEGKTVQIPVSAVGGGTRGIVFTYEYDESAVQPRSIEPLETESGAYITKCNYSFDECWELLRGGSPAMFVDKSASIVSSLMNTEWVEQSGGVASLAPFSVEAAPDGACIYMMFDPFMGSFYIDYAADYLNGRYAGAE